MRKDNLVDAVYAKETPTLKSKKPQFSPKILSAIRLGLMIVVVVFMLGAVGKLLYPLFFTVEKPPATYPSKNNDQSKSYKKKSSATTSSESFKKTEPSQTYAVAPKTQWKGTTFFIALNDLNMAETADTSTLKRGDSVLILQTITLGKQQDTCGLGLFGFENSGVSSLSFVAFDAQKTSKMELLAKYLKIPLRYSIRVHTPQALNESYESCQNWVLTEIPSDVVATLTATTDEDKGSALADPPKNEEVTPIKIKQGACRKVSTTRYLMYIPPREEGLVSFKPNPAAANSWELCGERVGTGQILTLTRKQGSFTALPLEVTSATTKKGSQKSSPTRSSAPKVYPGW